jgi:predicted RNase H-like HicB family nuclease
MEMVKISAPHGSDMAARNWAVVLEEGEDGYLVATVPELPTVVTQGRTKEEALTNAREAIELYLEYLRDKGEPLPKRHLETVQV